MIGHEKALQRSLPLSLSLVAALFISACGQLQAPSMPELPKNPETFRAAAFAPAKPSDRAAATSPAGPWWKVFADPKLDDLITRASDSNTSIQLAANRLSKARALMRQSESQTRPQISGSLGYARQDGPLINAAGSSGPLWNTGATLSYEADLFGRISKDIQASHFDAQAQQNTLQATHLLIQSEVAQTYFKLCGLDYDIVLMQSTLQSLHESLRLSLSRQANGSVSPLETSRAQLALAESEAEVLSLKRQRSESEHALALLLGMSPGELRLRELSWQAEIPAIPPGIPSDVLARRPDMATSLNRLRAAHARAGMAASLGLPSLNLGASSGFAATELSRLLSMSAHAWGLNALLSLPLFDGGRKQAGLDAAKADLEAALIQYRENALTAFREVEDQLSNLHWLTLQSQVQARSVVAAARNTALSAQRYQNGSLSQFEWLDAQRQEWRSRRIASGVRTSRSLATVALVRALGGGWATPVTIPPLSRAQP